MRPIGKIKAILNERVVLIASEEQLMEDETLIVYGEVPLSEELQQKLGIEKITIHKGYIVVGAQQGEKLYLGEASRLKQMIRKLEPPAWSTNFSALFGRQIEQEVDAGWSALIDKQQSLGIQISKLVKIDDFVSKQ